MKNEHYWIIVGVFPDGEEIEMAVQWKTRAAAQEVVNIASLLTPPNMRIEIRECSDAMN